MHHLFFPRSGAIYWKSEVTLYRMTRHRLKEMTTLLSDLASLTSASFFMSSSERTNFTDRFFSRFPRPNEPTCTDSWVSITRILRNFKMN